ncbi:hypothetical protein [Microbacterium sp.]|nr:hypothetical protein [Microbacterium sp.]
MDNSPALVIMLMTLPALIGSVVVAANAKRINAAAKERRAARAGAHTVGK